MRVSATCTSSVSLRALFLSSSRLSKWKLKWSYEREWNFLATTRMEKPTSKKTKLLKDASKLCFCIRFYQTHQLKAHKLATILQKRHIWKEKKRVTVLIIATIETSVIWKLYIVGFCAYRFLDIFHHLFSLKPCPFQPAIVFTCSLTYFTSKPVMIWSLVGSQLANNKPLCGSTTSWNYATSSTIFQYIHSNILATLYARGVEFSKF